MRTNDEVLFHKLSLVGIFITHTSFVASKESLLTFVTLHLPRLRPAGCVAGHSSDGMRCSEELLFKFEINANQVDISQEINLH